MTRSRAAIPTPVAKPTVDIAVAVGTDAAADLYVGGDDWTAAVSATPLAIASRSSGLGIHAAACFAAAEVSKRVLAPLGLPVVALPAEFVWNLLDHQLAAAADPGGRRRARARVAAFGCGSVGSSAMAVLVCIDPLTGDIWPVDPDIIDPTRNPYRYPALTGEEANAKAIWAAELMTAAGWTARPTQGDVASWVAAQPSPGLHGIALSSVDTIEGRRDVADVLAATTVSAGVAGLVRLGTTVSMTIAFSGACADTLTDAKPVPLSVTTRVESTTTPGVATPDLEAEPPAIVELPPDGDPIADPDDPVAVASALVMVLTNRRSDVAESSWHKRWSRLVTPALAVELDRTGAHGAFAESRAGNVVAIGVVVGSARRGSSSDSCQVIVIADETLLVNGHPVDERNFVSWQINMERSDASGWRASRIRFGTAS